MASKLNTTRQGSLAILTIDDGKANTVDSATFRDFLTELTAVEQSDAQALLITGRAGYFSAGLDLKKLPTLGADGLAETVQLFGEVMLRVFTFPRPVVAAISGHALGAGAILALASDVRLAAEGAFRFAMNEVPIGLTVPTFGIEIARASAPAHVHADLVLHGRTFSPEEAKGLFLVESLHAPEALAAAATARALGLTALNVEAYAQTKRMMRGAAAEKAQSLLAEESRRLTKPFVPG